MRRRRAVQDLTGFRVARLFGVDVTVHGSWVVSLGLLSGFAHLFIVEDMLPGRSALLTVPLAVLFALPIVACIVAHELGHCIVARAYGLRVRRITLFAFGGVSQIERGAPGPGAEFHIAMAGPVVSLVLATIFGAISRALNPGVAGLLGAWGAFATVNLMLTIFNLLPAFPMDGGRILRSALWALAGRRRATRLAVAGGRAFGIAIVVAGLALLAPRATGAPVTNGIYVVFMGVFLFVAAGAAGRSESGRDDE